MSEYEAISQIIDNKKIANFIITKKGKRELIFPRNGLMITNLIINNKNSDGNLRLIIGDAKVSKEIIEVGAGDNFQFSDISGMRFWDGSALLYEKDGDGKTLITIGYLRTQGVNFSIWQQENVPISEEFCSEIKEELMIPLKSVHYRG